MASKAVFRTARLLLTQARVPSVPAVPLRVVAPRALPRSCLSTHAEGETEATVAMASAIRDALKAEPVIVRDVSGA
jgi:hypothetical protein